MLDIAVVGEWFLYFVGLGDGEKFPSFDPRDIVKIHMLDDSDLVPMTPW